jgi:thiamine pyrophosphokinase
MDDVTVVVAGGGTTPQALPDGLASPGGVVAADSGLDLAERLGLAVDLVVGDLDSVSAGALERARQRGTEIEASPADKDVTDLELALVAARRRGTTRLVVLGGAGGRLDHLLANVAVLTGPLTDGMAVDAWLGEHRVQVVRDSVEVAGRPGSEVSLLAWHGDATGVTTRGLRWALDDAVLVAGAARGTSNLLEDDDGEVHLRSGVLTVTQRAIDALAAVGGRMVEPSATTAGAGR